MMSLGAAVPYLILTIVSLALLWGSIVALRGRRWWATVIMTVGSIMQIAGALLTCGGTVWMMMEGAGIGSSPSASSPSSVAATMGVIMMVIAGGLFVTGLGFLVFGAGFLGFCSQYGSAERRAKELEEVVNGLQERMES